MCYWKQYFAYLLIIPYLNASAKQRKFLWFFHKDKLHKSLKLTDAQFKWIRKQSEWTKTTFQPVGIQYLLGKLSYVSKVIFRLHSFKLRVSSYFFLWDGIIISRRSDRNSSCRKISWSLPKLHITNWVLWKFMSNQWSCWL